MVSYIFYKSDGNVQEGMIFPRERLRLGRQYLGYINYYYIVQNCKTGKSVLWFSICSVFLPLCCMSTDKLRILHTQRLKKTTTFTSKAPLYSVSPFSCKNIEEKDKTCQSSIPKVSMSYILTEIICILSLKRTWRIELQVVYVVKGEKEQLQAKVGGMCRNHT